jgi:hypothetical protein
LGESSQPPQACIVAGTTGGVLPGANRGYFPGQETAGDFDYFLKNYDLNGAEVWTCQSRTGGHGEVVESQGIQSGVFIVGITDGNAQRADVFVAKLKDVAHGCAPLFRRGDTNADTSVNLTDAMTILGFMFLGGGSPGCAKAADVNDDGANNLSDALTLLGYLFLGGQAPPEPSVPAAAIRPLRTGLAAKASPPVNRCCWKRGGRAPRPAPGGQKGIVSETFAHAASNIRSMGGTAMGSLRDSCF